MSYTLQAFVAKSGELPATLPMGLRAVPLHGGLALVPLTHEVCSQLSLPSLPLTDGSRDIPLARLIDLGKILSAHAQVAYVEAEYFGGAGAQAAIQFLNGAQMQGAIDGPQAINTALRWLGVDRSAHGDEFEAAGLGSKRDTDQW